VATGLLFAGSSNYEFHERHGLQRKEEKQMMYVNKRYLNMARKSELLQHERIMEQLQRQVAHLSKAVAWELEQHQTRLMELQRIGDSLAEKKPLAPLPPAQPALQPVPSSVRRWIKFRKHTHRSISNPPPQLVRSM
jgi:hypothetical protein